MARLFRLLGLHPTAELSLAAAASLVGLPPASVRPLLTRLVTASLVTQPSAGRYGLHDLLHAYAADLGRRVDSERVRRAAILRLLDHYLHTSLRANRLLYPTLGAAPGPPRRGITVEPIDDDQQAMHWFSVEQGALLAAFRSAGANGFDAHAAGLASTVAEYLDRGGRWHDLAEVQLMAVGVTDRLGDQHGQVDSRRLLARALLRLGRFDEARAYLMEALELCTAAGDLSGQAKIHHNLAMTWERQGEYAQALQHAGQALALYRSCRDVRGQALALNGVGWCESQLGRYEHALATCQEALVLLSRLGDRPGQADAWDSVGHAHQHLDDHASADHRLSPRGRPVSGTRPPLPGSGHPHPPRRLPRGRRRPRQRPGGMARGTDHSHGAWPRGCRSNPRSAGVVDPSAAPRRPRRSPVVRAHIHEGLQRAPTSSLPWADDRPAPVGLNLSWLKGVTILLTRSMAPSPMVGTNSTMMPRNHAQEPRNS